MTHSTEFATVLGCMDGRCQEKTFAYAKELFGKASIDTITEPGIDGILAGAKHPVFEIHDVPLIIKNIKAKAEISTNGHGSTQCLIVGHCSCAGNPGDLSMHKKHLLEALNRVRSWDMFEQIECVVFDEDWNVLPVDAVM